MTILFDAAKAGSIDELKRLKGERVNLHEKDKSGNTALLWAACCGHLEAVKWLLSEQGGNAKITEKNNTGNTALLLAAAFGHLTNKTIIFSQKFINRLKLLNKLLNISKINKVTHTVQTLLNIVSGIPMRDTLNQVFWRSKHELNITEDTLARDITSHDNGLLWFSPIIPFSESHFTKVHSLVRNILHAYGFECLFGCAGFSSHCLDVTIPIFFNKNDAQETERALACYDELFNQCLASGYMLYRIGVTKMHLLPNAPYDALNTKLKSILDINKILAPGRYVKEL